MAHQGHVLCAKYARGTRLGQMNLVPGLGGQRAVRSRGDTAAVKVSMKHYFRITSKGNYLKLQEITFNFLHPHGPYTHG